MKTNKFARAALAALLVAAIALAGCGYNPENVMTIDGEEVPAGRWLYFQMAAVSAAVTELDDSTVTGVDVLNHDIGDMPAADWVMTETVKNCKRYKFVENEFERLGLAFEASELDSIKSNVEMTWNYYAKDYYEANGIGYDSFMAVYLNRMKETKVLEALYSEGGEKAISAEDKQAYFDANFAQYEYFKLPTNDAVYSLNLLENYPDDVRALAANMLAMAQNDGLTKTYLALYSDALTLAQDTTTVVDEATAATAVTSGLISKALGYSDELCDAVLAVPVGEYGTAEADSTVYIFRRLALPADATEEANDATIVNAMAKEPFEEYVKNAIELMKSDFDVRAVNYYSAEKVKLA